MKIKFTDLKEEKQRELVDNHFWKLVPDYMAGRRFDPDDVDTWGDVAWELARESELKLIGGDK